MFGLFGENGLILQHKTNNNMELVAEIKKVKQVPVIDVFAWLFTNQSKFDPIGKISDDGRQPTQRTTKTHISPRVSVFFNRILERDRLVYKNAIHVGISANFGLYKEQKETPDFVGYTLEIKWQILWFYVRYNDFAWK